MTRKSSDGRKAPEENAPMRYDKDNLPKTSQDNYIEKNLSRCYSHLKALDQPTYFDDVVEYSLACM